MIADEIKGLRLAGIDYGKRRIGWAVCDELHISISTKPNLINEGTRTLKKIMDCLRSENVGAVIVGMPYRHDGQITEWMEEIKEFSEQLHSESQLPVYLFDEAYSSQQAVATMVAIGKKKKKRARKGEIDSVAAAIILREFLSENEG